MFRPIPGFVSELTEGVNTFARALHIPPLDAAMVAATLGLGDWTYLTLEGPCIAEVVRVTGAAADVLAVDRAVAGTDRRAFDVGTPARYTFTYAEAVDRVAAALSEVGLTITGDAAVTVDATGQMFSVSVPTIRIDPDCTAQILGTGDKLQVAKVIEAYGCCDVRLPQLPPFVYLTSRPYPVNAREALESSGRLVSAIVIGIARDAISSEGLLIEGDMRNIRHFYIMVDEALDSVGAIISGELKSIRHYYTMVDEALDSDGAIVSGTLRSVRVYYTMVDEAINSSGALVSGTLVEI